MKKTYKPLIEPLNTFVEETKVDRKKVLEENKNIPKKLTLEDKPPLLAIDKNLIETVNLGEIAVKYLSNAIKKNGYTQHMVKPIEGSNQFKFGNKKVDTLGNNIRIEGKLYELGEEEWKLLTLKDTGGLEDYSDEAWKN